MSVVPPGDSMLDRKLGRKPLNDYVVELERRNTELKDAITKSIAVLDEPLPSLSNPTGAMAGVHRAGQIERAVKILKSALG